MCTMISTFRGIRTCLEFKVPSQLCLEQNNEFLTCSKPSQCGISLSTSLSVSLFLSVTTYDTTKNQFLPSSSTSAMIASKASCLTLSPIMDRISLTVSAWTTPSLQKPLKHFIKTEIQERWNEVKQKIYQIFGMKYEIFWNDAKHTLTAKTWIYHTPYVCTERMFDMRKYFWKKLSLKLVAHIFTLLLAPFVYKLFNYSRHCDSLKNVWIWSNSCFWRKMLLISSFSESLKSHCASNNWPI